jgi:AmpD protein
VGIDAKAIPGSRRPMTGTHSMAARRRPGGTHGPESRRLAIDERGYANLARQVRSPNRDARPRGATVTLLVVHGISVPPFEFGGNAIIELFTNRLDPDAHPYYATIASLRVSAHFLVRRSGELLQFVGCDDRAWHAGASTWKGSAQCNDFSIGVELEGADDVPYTAAQYTMLARLARALRRRYPIVDIVGHSDIAPGRKTDPGPAFDWARLTRLLAPSARR